MPSIAVLTCYPLVKPFHGGQIRASNIVQKFRDAGFDVHTLSVFGEEGFQEYTNVDIPFPAQSAYRNFHGRHVPFIEDLQIYKFVEDEGTLTLALSRLPTTLDIIHVEQPWLWPLATAYKRRINSRVILCYGSQNIESDLKSQILGSMTGELYQELLPYIMEEVDALERRATKEADIVACVSEVDRSVHRSWGASKTIIAPNGVSQRPPLPAKIDTWKKKFNDTKLLLYVASAHPPNFTDFSRIMGGSLACFPPDTKLAVVGSVAEHIYHQCRIGPFASVNLSRLDLLFCLTSEDLEAVKFLAHGFLLPIPYGGGTNLKTAEALLSEKYVIGTETAFRGFEKYKEERGVYVCNSPDSIHKAIRHVFECDALSIEGEPPRNDLTWDCCLQPLVDALIRQIEGDVPGQC